MLADPAFPFLKNEKARDTLVGHYVFRCVEPPACPGPLGNKKYLSGAIDSYAPFAGREFLLSLSTSRWKHETYHNHTQQGCVQSESDHDPSRAVQDAEYATGSSKSQYPRPVRRP